MKFIRKVVTVAFLAISLMVWPALSEARRSHHGSGSRHYYGNGHRSHGYHGYRGSHRHRSRYRHFRPRRYFAPHYSYGHRFFHHRPRPYRHGHRSHFGIVLNFHNALEYVPSHKASTWRNPDTGYSETLTPVKTYQTREGRYCREYVKTVTIGGEQQQVYGTACRQPDGSWVTVNK